MKKTAVEWFFYELYSIRITIPFKDQGDAILKAFEQAKAMEIEQIYAAWVDGFYTDWRSSKMPSDYYDETFKQQDDELRTKHD